MDIELVEKLVRILQDSDSEELSLNAGDLQVTIRRGAEHGVAEESPHESAGFEAAEASHAEPPDPLVRVTAEMVGIFHPAEGLKAGERIELGQVIGAIESMKLANEVHSPEAGVVRETHAEDGSPVEYGQVLISLEKETQAHAAA